MTHYKEIIRAWKTHFIEYTRMISGSTKQTFTYRDALLRSTRSRKDYDTVIIDYLKFIENNPLKNNDYFKYINAYRDKKKLNLRYFRHDKIKLQEYYKKIDENPSYNPFDYNAYQEYVLFMMLKLYGVYKTEFDDTFNVKKTGNRIYSPLSKIPSVLRGELPMKVKEYDIYRAYPTFLDLELKIENRKEDVYAIIEKKTFNSLLNIHSEVHGANLSYVRKQLKPIYGTRTTEVLTDTRFNTKGQMFNDLSKYEEKFINEFITRNNIQNYVRLHDGIYVLDDVTCKELEIGVVKFAAKEVSKPALNDVPCNFYLYNDNMDLITTQKLYGDFLTQENFIRGTEENNDKIIIFKDTNNVVSPFNYRTETVKFLKEHINELMTDDIENRIAKENSTTIFQGLHLVPSMPIIYYTDNPKDFGLPFKNGFVHISKEKSLNYKEYKDVNGFFAPHRIQGHTFSEDSKTSVFELFLTMVSTGKDPRTENLTTEDNQIFESFCLMFGYMCHSYKNPSLSPAIILSDEGANDISRNGGRGKSILITALQNIQPSIFKGGNEFKPSYTHNFADLTSEKRIYIIDDVPAAFRYDDLYTNIVGSISCQRKNIEAIEIPFEKAPKFIITTNWSVRYDESNTSTNRRFFEYKFTNFFNLGHTPKDVFGHNLFTDWDDIEWNLFYNFTYKCVRLFLNKSLQRIQYDKTEDNFKAIFSNDSLHDEFERVLTITLNRFKEFAANDFLSIYNYHENSMRHEKLFSTRNIKRLIDTYVKHHNLNISYVQSSRKWINDDFKSNTLPDL